MKASNSVYQRKRDVLSDALRTNLPDGCSFQVPEGGFFIWLALPKAVDAAELLPTAMNKYGVGYLPGVHCAPNSNEWKNYCRICFCHYEEEQLIEATLRLSRALGAGQG
ncbi:hypothetical protein NVV94_10465 [Pseudomonas sp. LS1212]|uniref:hypothetical protein n=1 Tax=Pseudomonas sp. LS1212 TaxID=2972478 RepID=UPI00215C1105|nr:hypothetical protein [Pseudomonas sp. LS1212]UVJ45924.1 hypothetical protein NVV94_10465 [Pseudomonas sp. LS1212]